MELIKDEIYCKYKDNSNADGFFNYLLTEYNCQPKDFLFYESYMETSSDLLDKVFKLNSLRDMKEALDNFFIDYNSQRQMTRGIYY